jgi:hypothetical protein
MTTDVNEKETTVVVDVLPNLCPVCIQDIDERDQESTECSHVFHKKCLGKWIRLNTNCPVCRKDLPELAPTWTEMIKSGVYGYTRLVLSYLFGKRIFMFTSISILVLYIVTAIGYIFSGIHILLSISLVCSLFLSMYGICAILAGCWYFTGV